MIQMFSLASLRVVNDPAWRLKQLITENYREPEDHGKFEDCAEELFQELIKQDESDDEE